MRSTWGSQAPEQTVQRAGDVLQLHTLLCRDIWRDLQGWESAVDSVGRGHDPESFQWVR